MTVSNRYLKLLAAGLFACLTLIVLAALLLPQTPHLLKVSFLDVGQGDSILIQGPTGRDVLIDGGPDNSALRELPKLLGPLDRSLDLVVETHPDADHITGLPSIFERYRIGAFMEPGRPDDTSTAEALLAAVAHEKDLVHVLGRAGERVDLGGGAYADILSPAGDVSQIETNTGSIIMRVVYGDTSFMLTGDAPSSIEEYLVKRYGTALKTDVLKAGHHGSKNSSSDIWLATVRPAAVIVSAGKDNRYGHPAPEAVARIEAEGALLLSTIDIGTITFVSDGKEITKR